MASMAAAALAPVGCTGSSGGSGGGSSGGAASGSQGGSQAGAGAGQGPILLSATLEDADASGGASAGDAIVLGFDEDIDGASLSLAGVRLLSAADSLGAGASVSAQGPREARVTLGQGAALSLYGTYKPGGPAGAGTVPGAGANRSPAAISVDAGALRGAGGVLSRAGRPTAILLPRGARTAFQPEQTRGAYSPFLGQMHAHTTYSDGRDGVPADAYDMARANGLDWFAVTDHLEYLPVQPYKFPQKKDQARARTIDGTFVGMWGYEWGSGIANPLRPSMYNHVNVLSDELVDVLDATTLHGFYAELARLGDDPICKFNHPNAPAKSSSMGISLHFDNWDDYRYDGGADRFIRFVRCMQGDQNDREGYLPLLDHGWHSAPGFGEDNHGASWGQSACRMGVFATSLTLEGIRDAMRARRSFTTGDRDAWLRVMAEDPAGAVWMGSSILGPGPVTITIDAGDATDGFDKLEVVSLGGAAVLTESLQDARTHATSFTADPSDDAYYFVRLTQTDGDIVYSAPIFIDR